MSTDQTDRFTLAERTRYRYESDLEMFMIYSAHNGEFRVAGTLARDVITGLEEGKAIPTLATELNVSESAIRTFCQECLEHKFLTPEDH